MFLGQLQGLAQGLVDERAHDPRAQAQGLGLEKEALAGVAHLHVGVHDAPVSITRGAALKLRREDHHYRRGCHPGLGQAGPGHLSPKVSFQGGFQGMILGAVAVEAGRQIRHPPFSGHQVDFQGVGGAGRGRGAVTPGIGDPLGGPQELGELFQIQGTGGKEAHGAAFLQGLFHGHGAFESRLGQPD